MTTAVKGSSVFLAKGVKIWGGVRSIRPIELGSMRRFLTL